MAAAIVVEPQVESKLKCNAAVLRQWLALQSGSHTGQVAEVSVSIH